MTCQALVGLVDGAQRVCLQPRAVSWLVTCGSVSAFVDLCGPHGELVELNLAETAERPPAGIVNKDKTT